jgi:hypothetical protein
MNWHYAIGAERKGPVSEEEFQRLSEEGVITAETLVWREGMTEWQPRGRLDPQTFAGPLTVCTACGKIVEQTEAITVMGLAYCASCKPQVVESLNQGKPLPAGNAEALRTAHLSHEASVKSVGILYYLGGAALFCMGASILITGAAGKSDVPSMLTAAFFLLFAVAQIWTGTGLRRLEPWARLPTGILSGLGLLGFPLGTLINGYILYLVFSKKGAVVFSPEYRAAVAQTPHIKYQTSFLVWVLLGIVVVLVGLAVAAAVFGKS